LNNLHEYRLRIKSIGTKEGLEKLSDLLNFFDLEDAVARYEETKNLFDFGLKYAKRTSMKLSMEFFLEGIKSYIFGFNEAAVFYSSLSVELMLLLKASKKSNLEELSKEGRLSFWRLIHETKILDQKHVTIAENLNLLRNCYVHFQNEILYRRIEFEENRKFLETCEDERISKQIKDEVIASVRNLQRYIEGIFPLLPSLVRDKNYIPFMKRRYHLYWEWINKEKRWTPRKLLEAGPREVLRTSQGRFDALDAVKWSKCLLEFLYEA